MTEKEIFDEQFNQAIKGVGLSPEQIKKLKKNLSLMTSLLLRDKLTSQYTPFVMPDISVGTGIGVFNMATMLGGNLVFGYLCLN